MPHYSNSLFMGRNTTLPHNSHTISIEDTHLNHIAGHQDHYINGIKAIAKCLQRLIVRSFETGLNKTFTLDPRVGPYQFNKLVDDPNLEIGCRHSKKLTAYFTDLEGFVTSAAANLGLKDQIIATYQAIGSVAQDKCAHEKHFAPCEKAFKYLFESSAAPGADLDDIIGKCANFEHAFP